MKDYRSLSHTKWDCKYHVVFIPKYRRKRIFGKLRGNFTGESFWARGYFVSTVGLDEVVVREYIRNQEKEDKRLEQLNLDWSSKELD